MPLNPHSLTCEYQNCAPGIDNPDPLIGWKLDADGNGARQTAYRVTVSDERGETLYDSGKIISDRQFGIQTAPKKKLTPMCEYSFTVTVWDENDVPSPAVSSYFLTGFFKAHQWRGDWFRVWNYGSVHFYRREFTLVNVARIRYAYAFIGAFGDKGNSCVPFINGRRISDLACFPGASEYFSAQYVCCDVKELLKEGENAVGLMLARTASIIIKVKYQDGTEVFIDCRRDEWKTKTGGGYTLGYAESMNTTRAMRSRVGRKRVSTIPTGNLRAKKTRRLISRRSFCDSSLALQRQPMTSRQLKRLRAKAATSRTSAQTSPDM